MFVSFHFGGQSTIKMKNNDNNTATTTGISITPEQAAENVKIIARRIREDSARIRDIVKTLHMSGAIEELATAVREAAIATRDTSREINETAKEMRTATVTDAAREAKESPTPRAAETQKQVTKRTRKNTAPVSRRKKRDDRP
jgi:hypothetical protein